MAIESFNLVDMPTTFPPDNRPADFISPYESYRINFDPELVSPPDMVSVRAGLRGAFTAYAQQASEEIYGTDLDSNRRRQILDPSCGIGSFLVGVTANIAELGQLSAEFVGNDSNIPALEFGVSNVIGAMVTAAEKKRSTGQLHAIFESTDWLSETFWQTAGKFDVIYLNPPYAIADKSDGDISGTTSGSTMYSTEPQRLYESLIKKAVMHTNVNGSILARIPITRDFDPLPITHAVSEETMIPLVSEEMVAPDSADKLGRFITITHTAQPTAPHNDPAVLQRLRDIFPFHKK